MFDVELKPNIKSDIKAEVIAADLVDIGYDIDDIAVNNSGISERDYRKDILKIEFKRDKNGDKELIFIDVSREGIYNGLPEAMFHTFDREKKVNSASFIEEYKRHKAEEEAATMFFQAFEKELFRMRIMNELTERKSMLTSNAQFKSDLFLNLWPELKQIADKYVAGLLLLLPVSHKVVGDAELACTLLSHLLDVPITYRYDDKTRGIDNHTGSNVLGAKHLAIDFVIGDSIPDYSPTLELVVGPVPKSMLTEVLHKGEIRKVLDLACKYLFPIVLDINITVEIDRFEEKFLLSESLQDGRLGFTSRL
ncbi:MAG: type VI secretion system baseplate subunit TssG [Chitinophagales bacterium]|nr:type VI secretion system baseplate subunit TssG [Chitinophagales bacterium]